MGNRVTRFKHKQRKAAERSASNSVEYNSAVSKTPKLTNEDKADLYYMRHSFNWASSAVGSVLYAYGTGWKKFWPESFQNHLDSLTDLAETVNIPYDPNFIRFYAGSFGGALVINAGAQLYAENTNKLSQIFIGKNLTIAHDKEYNPLTPAYDTLSHGLNSPESRAAFITVGTGLTGVEMLQSIGDNRSFDYGDMITYTVAFALCAGGLTVATRRAARKMKESHQPALNAN